MLPPSETPRHGSEAGPSIVWFRDDLRLADNPALNAAIERGEPLVLLYLLDQESPEIRPLGGASRWWLHGSLSSLADEIRQLGGSLTLRIGPAALAIPALVEETSAGAVFWNRRYGAAKAIDAALKSTLRDRGVQATSFQANLLFEPWTVTTGSGGPYRVFTPFWRACLDRPEPRTPLPAPESLVCMSLPSESLADWRLLPQAPDWAAGLRERWTPGEASANETLEAFASTTVRDYHRRDEPAAPATSGLSPHLRFGELSPFQVWHRMRGALPASAKENAAKFLSELGWREFNWSILYNAPDLAERNIRADFDAFPWEQPRQHELEAWQRGRTGIPLVDAGMRELWASGTMHNRVRMIAASFLVKNLLVDWRIGERWFWDTLVDADEASNPGNWQWVAGSGADAAPYFRVFNPVLQAQKFDADSEYQRRWLPEFGTPDYPEPIVDLAATRREALAAYELMKAAAGPR